MVNNPVTINTTSLTKPRIESIDLLKGLVIVIMALDHVRDYFHYSAFMFDPSDPAQSNLPIFFTRLITHFCAPAFSFLAGLSAYMVGRRKTPYELSIFLIKRGLWLMLIDMTVIVFGWHFDPQFRDIVFNVVSSLGIGMIVLAGLIHLPKSIIIAFSCLVIFGHNLLDNIHFDGSVLWSFLHERHPFLITEGYHFRISYPIIPWVAVMSLGYCIGSLYDSSVESAKRKRVLNIAGLSSLALFFVLIGINRYGDAIRWTHFDETSKTIMSMLNMTKYPPSLKFLLMTLGGTFLFLANSEKLKGKLVNYISTFGRAPFFFYIVHIYFIHFLALFAAEFTGFGWRTMIVPIFVNRVAALKGYGFGLWVVYVVWIAVILLLYPLCKRFDTYKQAHKEKWWLSYL
jgi:uncharacterized membrane protein